MMESEIDLLCSKEKYWEFLIFEVGASLIADIG